MTADPADPADGAWRPSDADVARLFSSLETCDRVLLAVSGGSDSMALLHLAARWLTLAPAPRPTIEVATVDHQLRPGSRAEAENVAAVSASLGLKHHLLVWDQSAEAPISQQSARDARYALLHDAVAGDGKDRAAVVTAHTRDDQAETFLMRLARGSGPDGLQAMRPERPLRGPEGVALLRPLLSVSRASLRAYLRSLGGSWIDDPSNEDPRFERIRVRHAGPALAEIGLTPSKLCLAAARQARAVSALNWATVALERDCLEWHDGAFAVLDGAAFFAAPDELQVRVLGRLLAVLKGSSEAADLSQVERLAADLATNAALRTTLSGCEIRACARQIRIFREAGRADLAPQVLPAGASCIWDHRFLIARPPAMDARRLVPDPEDAAHFDVKPLSASDLRTLRKTDPRWRRIPARAAATLPAVWSGTRLVGVGGLHLEGLRRAEPHSADGPPSRGEARRDVSREIIITPIWRGEIGAGRTEVTMPGDGVAELT